MYNFSALIPCGRHSISQTQAEVVVDIMRLYKTCNSHGIVGTFSVYNLLKYAVMLMCVYVYLYRMTYICMYS